MCTARNRDPVETLHEQARPALDIPDQLHGAQRDPQFGRVPEHDQFVLHHVRELGGVEFEDEPLAGTGDGERDHPGGQFVLDTGEGHWVDQVGVAEQLVEVHWQLGVELDGVLVRVQRFAMAHNLHVAHRVRRRRR